MSQHEILHRAAIHYSLRAEVSNNMSMCTSIIFSNDTNCLKAVGQLHRVKFHISLQFKGLIIIQISKSIKTKNSNFHLLFTATTEHDQDLLVLLD